MVNVGKYFIHGAWVSGTLANLRFHPVPSWTFLKGPFGVDFAGIFCRFLSREGPKISKMFLGMSTPCHPFLETQMP